MKIGLAQIKTGENPFRDSSQQPGWAKDLVARVAAQGTRIVGPLAVEMVLTKLEPDYYLKGRMEFTVEQACGRCAESFTLPIQHPFELGLAHIKGQGRGSSDALSEESEELDIHFFEGNELDLGPVLEEQVFLSLPYAPICRTTCRGICQGCGKDLNTGDCRCKKIKALNAFSALAGYKA